VEIDSTAGQKIIMSCEVTREGLQEYLDGQLPPGRAAAVGAHIQACASCRQELGLLRQVDAALAMLPLVTEPPDFTARVMARVRPADRRAAEQPPFRLRWEDALVSFAFAWAAATVLMLALLALNVSTVVDPLRQGWGTLLIESGNLWRTVQAQPAYGVWGVSLFGMTVATAVAGVQLLRWRLSKPHLQRGR
jgi:predicted anti-sigma-YlaC factor YlaD